MDMEVTVEPELGSTIVLSADGPAFCNMFNAVFEQALGICAMGLYIHLPRRALTF